MPCRTSHLAYPRRRQAADDERGFVLLGLIVVIFIILLTLSVAAPTIAKDLRRDREVETVNRGKQYIRAIQLYYKKFGTYPGSIAQLEKVNNIRYLRQRYLDPMTGKDDWRVIPVGQNQTQVKWFFGQPLTGIAGGGLGSASGMASTGMGTTPAAGGAAAGGAFGSGGFGAAPGAGGLGGASGGGAFGATPSTPGATTAPGAPTDPGAAGTSSPGGGASGTPGSNSPLGGSGSPGGLGSVGSAFMGVGINAPGDSIVDWNQSTSYATWEFLYDPRLDMMIQKAKLANGGGVGSAAAGSLGQTPGGIGTSGSTPGASGTPGTSGGFGSSGPAGSFGSPTTPPTGTTPPPQP